MKIDDIIIGCILCEMNGKVHQVLLEDDMFKNVLYFINEYQGGLKILDTPIEGVALFKNDKKETVSPTKKSSGKARGK